MGKFVCAPLGCSTRQLFLQELNKLPYGEGILILPNRLSMDEVKCTDYVETMGIDTLANKLLNANGHARLDEISRRSQELVVEDIVDYMMHNKDLQQLDDKPLKYFGNLASKKGFIKAMTSLVGQLSRSGATEEQINLALVTKFEESTDKNSSNKDEGVRNLYLLYRQYLKNNKWYDLEGKYRLAVKALERKKPRVPWKKIYFSDFYSFDNLQLTFIEKLAEHCDVTVGMCYEETESLKSDRGRIFEAGRKTHNSLETIFGRKERMSAQDLTQLAAPDLQHLRDNIGKVCSPVSAQNIKLYSFADKESEMRWVLANVKNQLRNNAVPQKILIAVRDLDVYSGLRLLADEYGIPVSLPQTTALAVQPLAELVQLLLKSVVDTHDGAEAYFRLLTSGLMSFLLEIDAEKIDLWRSKEYYVRRSDVQLDILTEFGEDSDALLQKIDKFIADTVYSDTLAGYVEKLNDFIVELKLEKRLGELYKKGKMSLDNISLCLRTRDTLVSTLQQLVHDYECCGRKMDKLSLSDWRELLSETLAAGKLIVKHGRQDGVLITSVVNVQGLTFDTVYIMGVRESEFPKVNNENWIYNDKERSQLIDLGVDLPTTAIEYSEDAYFFASAAATALNRLYITWDEADGLKASAYVDNVQKIFQNLYTETAPLQVPASVEEVERLGKTCDRAWLEEKVGSVLMQAIQADILRRENSGGSYNGVLTDAALQADVRKAVGNSFNASKLELYAACPFRYLGEQLWKQQIFSVKEDIIEPADEGSLLHRVLAEFVGSHLQEKITQYSLEKLQSELQKIFEKVCQEFIDNGSFVEGILWNIEKIRLWKLLKNWLKFEYDDQLSWNDYKPTAVEWDFSSKNGKPLRLQLDDKSFVTLTGRIDRIDSDGEHLFVTDYKRSKYSVPSSKDLERKLDVQLPLYLLAAAALYKGGKPVSGGSYFVLQDTERKSKFLLKDVHNEDLPFRTAKNEDFATWEKFQHWCEEMIKEYIDGIYQSNFAVLPKCDCSEYCQLKNICRLQETLNERS